MPGPRAPARSAPPGAPARRRSALPSQPASRPLDTAEVDELQALLDSVPAPLEPLDVSMLDGYLCGVLLQPRRVAAPRWLLHITDADGCVLPPRFDTTRLHALAQRRHAELDAAIERREWFDPWVFELDEPGDADGSDTDLDAVTDTDDTDDTDDTAPATQG